MRLKLFILIFSFANLLVTPTLVMLQDSGDDISFFITANEEENSEKNGFFFGEYVNDEFKRIVSSQNYYFSESFSHFICNYKSVYQQVVSPPPDFKLNYFS